MKFKVEPALERIMNDVKYADPQKAWIGCDLDGTLAKYDGWKGWQHIGEPVEKMVLKLKSYMERGLTVKIWTARCSKVSLARSNITFEQMSKVIQDWTEKVFGKRLEVVTEKDCDMLFTFDDSVMQVEPNTGNIIGSEIMVDLGDDGDYTHPIKEYISADVAHQDHWNQLPIDSVLINDFVDGCMKGGFKRVTPMQGSPAQFLVQGETDNNVTRFSFYTCTGNLFNENSTDWIVVDVQLANGSSRMFYKIDNLSFKSLGKWLTDRVIHGWVEPKVVQQ